MTTAEDIKKCSQEVPFRPCRLHLIEGGTFEVKHPDFLFVMKQRAIIGEPGKADSPFPESAVLVSLLPVVSVEEFRAA